MGNWAWGIGNGELGMGNGEWGMGNWEVIISVVPFLQYHFLDSRTVCGLQELCDRTSRHWMHPIRGNFC